MFRSKKVLYFVQRKAQPFEHSGSINWTKLEGPKNSFLTL